MNFKTLNNPIMLVSDNPCLPTGLARMCRDLATLCCTMPEFRVAVLGRGMGQMSALPFIVYDYPESGQWGEDYIKRAWEDFAGNDYGIIMTLDDASRRHWFAHPIGLPQELAEFLGPVRSYQKWGYFPFDGPGPRPGMLPLAMQDCVEHYDQTLACTEFGYSLLSNTRQTNIDWLPHGFSKAQFCPHPNSATALDWVGKTVVGCVMANQSRKDYPVAFQTFALLRNHLGPNFKAWLHTDTFLRYWNVQALACEYGLGDCLEVTMELNDHQLAMRYSACAATMLPSGGEGFGFPIIESQACGTPCVVTDFAGGAELSEYKVSPQSIRLDTQHCVCRAQLSAKALAETVLRAIKDKQEDWEGVTDKLVDRVSYLEWNHLKHSWMRWLRGGLCKR